MSSTSTSSAPVETCDFCHAPLADLHQHLLESTTRKLECVCDACAILFSDPGQKYRRVPRRIRFLPEFRMDDAQWDELAIPIGIAFLFINSAAGKVSAIYPSPGGPVESLLALESWENIVRDNPEVGGMTPDVEGLLVYRVRGAREHYIIPIDECFKLIGIVRTKWKGLSGGSAVWDHIGEFLQTMKQRSTR